MPVIGESRQEVLLNANVNAALLYYGDRKVLFALETWCRSLSPAYLPGCVYWQLRTTDVESWALAWRYMPRRQIVRRWLVQERNTKTPAWFTSTDLMATAAMFLKMEHCKLQFPCPEQEQCTWRVWLGSFSLPPPSTARPMTCDWWLCLEGAPRALNY
jgi:hypothetical protein